VPHDLIIFSVLTTTSSTPLLRQSGCAFSLVRTESTQSAIFDQVAMPERKIGDGEYPDETGGRQATCLTLAFTVQLQNRTPNN
jgi:hypothetical protein